MSKKQAACKVGEKQQHQATWTSSAEESGVEESDEYLTDDIISIHSIKSEEEEYFAHDEDEVH